VEEGDRKLRRAIEIRSVPDAFGEGKMKPGARNDRRSARDRAKIFGPAIVVTLVGFVVAYQFVAPAPPRSISIGTSQRESAFYTYAESYRELLAEEGIELELRTSAGSVENLALLEAEHDGVDVAFVQGGLGPLAKTDNLVSLCSVFLEPLWILCAQGLDVNRLPDLKGLRVAVGAEGSGTRVLALHLLDLNGITDETAHLLTYGHQEAADMLRGGEIDVAMFVSTHRATYVLDLLRSGNVKLMGLERAEAYALRYHYLYVLNLPEGVLDFVTNSPNRDLPLVAPTTQLVARSDLHPALVNLLLQAAEEVHESGGAFEKEGEFPSPKYLDFELSEEAERFFESGPPFLQRYLPFWVAIFVTRMKVMLLPLVALLFPLFRLMPVVYRWRMRSKIYRWYSSLEAVDPDMHKEDLSLHSDRYLDELDRIEERVARISLPLAYAEELYALRLHMDMLRKKLQAARENETPES
jgi:TRAP transporter TAXI family solute receptor